MCHRRQSITRVTPFTLLLHLCMVVAPEPAISVVRMRGISICHAAAHVPPASAAHLQGRVIGVIAAEGRHPSSTACAVAAPTHPPCATPSWHRFGSESGCPASLCIGHMPFARNQDLDPLHAATSVQPSAAAARSAGRAVACAGKSREATPGNPIQVRPLSAPLRAPCLDSRLAGTALFLTLPALRHDDETPAAACCCERPSQTSNACKHAAFCCRRRLCSPRAAAGLPISAMCVAEFRAAARSMAPLLANWRLGLKVSRPPSENVAAGRLQNARC